MIGELVQLFPLVLFVLLAFWRPTWLKGVLFIIAAGDALVVGLTWRQAFPGTAGLGTSVCFFGLFVIMVACFFKVLLAGRRQQEVEDEE